jgi:hypothetical protein
MASQFKTFTSGAVLTAAEVNSYLMKQAVIVCDSSADYPSAPVEGMVVYDKALDAFLAYTGAAWQQTLQLAARNTANTWTPVITQSGTVTHTATYARYSRNGRLITAECLLAVTGSGTGANPITVSLPATAAQAGNMAIGSGYIYDSVGPPNATNYCGVAIASTTSVAAMMPTSGDSGSFLGQGVFTAALASGDVVSLSIKYEAAS